MNTATEDLRRAYEVVTAMHVDGDVMAALRPYLDALAEDRETGADRRRIGLVNALAVMAASALAHLDSTSGQGAGQAWLQESALREVEGIEQP